MPRLRMAVVGLNHPHVAGFLTALGALRDDLELVGTVEANGDWHSGLAPELRSLPRYDSLDDLLATGNLDAALVTLPNDQAPEAVRRLAGAGIHMIVDKPGARTAAEAEWAAQSARAAGVRVAVGFGQRFNPGPRDVRAMVAAGKLGRLYAMESTYATSNVFVRNPEHYLFDRSVSGGGMLHWLGIHMIDLMRWISGDEVSEVCALMGNPSGAPVDVEEVAAVALRFCGGAVATLHCGYVLPRNGNEGHFAVRGGLGSATMELTAQPWPVQYFGSGGMDALASERQITHQMLPQPGYGWAVVRDFVTAVREGRDPEATLDDAAAALRVVDGAYASAAGGRTIKLDGWGRHNEDRSTR